MFKPRKLQASIDRMRQRAQKSQALPPVQQGSVYYCAGMSPLDFEANIAAGDNKSILWALDVVLAELPLSHAFSGARYISRAHAALKNACAIGQLSAEHIRAMEDIERRILYRLMLRAFHSAPCPAQERAERRIPEQLKLMKELFHRSYEDVYIDYEAWPAVAAPEKLIRRAFRKAKLPTELSDQFVKSSYELLMDVYHAPETLFPPQMKLETIPQTFTSKLCYFFCRETEPIAEWVIAPLHELEGLCGFIIAADGSFFYNADECNSGYGALLN